MPNWTSFQGACGVCLNWASLWRVARNQEWLWGGVKSFLLSCGTWWACPSLPPSALSHSDVLAACVHADRDSSLLLIALTASVGFWREKPVVAFQLSSTFTTQLPHHHSSYVWIPLQHTQRTQLQVTCFPPQGQVRAAFQSIHMHSSKCAGQRTV